MSSTPAGVTGWKEGSWHRGGPAHSPALIIACLLCARTLPPGIQFIESIRCLWDMCKSHESLQSSTDSPFVLFIISSCAACFEPSFVIWKSTTKTKQKGGSQKAGGAAGSGSFVSTTALFLKMFLQWQPKCSKMNATTSSNNMQV